MLNDNIKVSVMMADIITGSKLAKIYSKHFKSICKFNEVLPDGSIICWNDPAERKKVNNLIELLTIKLK